MKGYVQIYTGCGKGKTTASIGLAIRASGSKKRTYIGQFMKGQKYGELFALKNNLYIDIEQFGIAKCIRKEEVTSEYIEKTKKALEQCKGKIINGNYDIVILDEIIVAIWFGLATEKDVLEIIDNKPGNLELVLTGRYASQTLIDKADLVTEMKCIKHYYDTGVSARKGIEN
jgi:cob(I)alamin adenosyltransferase